MSITVFELLRPPIMAIIGLLLYVAASRPGTNARWSFVAEVGRIMFAAGMFAIAFGAPLGRLVR